MPSLCRDGRSLDGSLWLRSREFGPAFFGFWRHLYRRGNRTQNPAQIEGWFFLPGVLRQDAALWGVGENSGLCRSQRRCSGMGCRIQGLKRGSKSSDLPSGKGSSLVSPSPHGFAFLVPCVILPVEIHATAAAKRDTRLQADSGSHLETH